MTTKKTTSPPPVNAKRGDGDERAESKRDGDGKPARDIGHAGRGRRAQIRAELLAPICTNIAQYPAPMPSRKQKP